MNVMTIITICIFGLALGYSLIMLIVGLIKRRKINKQIMKDGAEDEDI